MDSHRLKREIIATQVTNSMVNRMGASFALRMHEDTGANPAQVAKAFTIAREIFAARDFWTRVEALDNKVSARLQTRALLAMWNLLRQVTRWLLNRPAGHLDIRKTVDRLAPGLVVLGESMASSMSADEANQVAELMQPYVDGGFPRRLAKRIASMPLLYAALDVVESASQRGIDVKSAAEVFFGLGDKLGLKWLREHVETLPVKGQWHAHARANLRDELHAHHRELADRVLKECGGAKDPVACWMSQYEEQVKHITEMMHDMESLSGMDYATVSVAVRSLAHLVSVTL
jgi:glutamate dehydrogenase